MHIESQNRFSKLAGFYHQFRPDYPIQVIYFLKKNLLLDRDFVVADLGSGTGKASTLFLPHVKKVIGIEPNDAMRQQAEHYLFGQRNYECIDATAEHTTLPDHSVDVVVCGQSFHWFDADAVQKECTRILKTNRPVLLMWNRRQDEASGFMQAYNDFLNTFSTSDRIDHRKSMRETVFARFYTNDFEHAAMNNEQVLTFDGLLGRYLSSSYAFQKDHPRHQEAVEALENLFRKFEYRGTVTMIYKTHLFYGIFNKKKIALWKKTAYHLLRIPAFFVYLFLITGMFFSSLFKKLKKKISGK